LPSNALAEWPGTAAGHAFFTIDPLSDSRWDKFVATHPGASIFHHSGWLRSLAKTYGFRPVVFTCTPGGQPLSNGIPFCEVQSWITGSRLVSLPFSDHCEPLLGGEEDLAGFIAWIAAERTRSKWKYVELRPRRWKPTGALPLSPTQSFVFHSLSLEPPLSQIFSSLHKDSVQRRIRRAEREGLLYEKGCSVELLDSFYRLLIMTRARHGLPPQPRSWFCNLLDHLRSHAEIRVARKGAQTIAAIMSFKFRDTIVDKYACSDHNFHQLGGMPFLFWKLIEESKAEGLKELDFGRTDLDAPSLIRFKDHFGTVRDQSTYFRFGALSSKTENATAYLGAARRRVFSLLPRQVSSFLGELLYRHAA
jgi:CelD/BcsL family acetyltransferase involved in cellulose biosynthesis